jgi:hypothetical protein
MKYLMEEVAKLFDDYREQVSNAWVNEIQTARAEKVPVDLSKVMAKLPNTPFAKFTKLFNEAEDRLEAKHKQTNKKGLFGK